MIGILLIYVFSVECKSWAPALGLPADWCFPSFGRGETVKLGWWSTGLLTASGLKALVLPAFTLSLFQMTLVLRLVRSQMLEVLRTDYIKFARARGLTNRAVHFRHALKNTLLPVITVIGLQVGGLIAFSIITETVFQWPGMGQLFIQSVQFADIPVMAAYLVHGLVPLRGHQFLRRPALCRDRSAAPARPGSVGHRGRMNPKSANLPWALIGAACLGSFAATSSGTTRAPFLLDMAHDLDVSMPLVANLVSLTSISWGVTSALGGWLSDVVGRRPLLVAALFALALAVLAQALAGSFFWIAVWATVGGGCSGAFMGVVFAEVSGRVPDSQRGRALGWVMSGQSLTLVIGVPMAAAVGSLIGWRGWLVCVGGLAFAASLSLFAAVGRGTAGHMRGGVRPSLRTALSPKVLGLLGTGIAERICYGLAAVYFATFLQATYHLSLVETAIPLAVFALGNVAGTILGGQLADRLRDRLLTFAIAMALSGVAALALFMWHPSLTISVALGFVYVFLNALGRPSYMASLAAVPEDVRGTVLGLNGTTASVGWIGAAALGAAMIGSVGFEGFGPLAASLAFAATVGALLNRRRAS